MPVVVIFVIIFSVVAAVIVGAVVAVVVVVTVVVVVAAVRSGSPLKLKSLSWFRLISCDRLNLLFPLQMYLTRPQRLTKTCPKCRDSLVLGGFPRRRREL